MISNKSPNRKGGFGRAGNKTGKCCQADEVASWSRAEPTGQGRGGARLIRGSLRERAGEGVGARRRKVCRRGCESACRELVFYSSSRIGLPAPTMLTGRPEASS